jgi:hypothetical protein
MSARAYAEPMPYVMPDTPFRVKGVVFVATRPYFDAHVPGGYDTLLAGLPPSLREFMEQPFVSGALYEVMHLPDLIGYEARAARSDPDVYLRARSRWQAERDLGGIYKLIARAAPAAIVVRRTMVLLPQMLNFGKPQIRSESATHVQVEISDVPVPLVAWLESVVVIYARTVAEQARLTGVRIDVLPRAEGGYLHGFPTLKLNFEARWGLLASLKPGGQ